MRVKDFGVAALFLIGSAVTARSAETITYTYDAQGRVIQVRSSGSANGPSTTTYTYDAAGNRLTVSVVKS